MLCLCEVAATFLENNRRRGGVVPGRGLAMQGFTAFHKFRRYVRRPAHHPTLPGDQGQKDTFSSLIPTQQSLFWLSFQASFKLSPVPCLHPVTLCDAFLP